MTQHTNVLSRRTLLKVSLAGLAFGIFPASADPGTAPMVDLLREGGYVIYFRHAATTWSGVDRIDWPRERQRLLSETGIAQSERIGEAFASNEIPVGEVLASPFARCRDMAEIAFGRVEERIELLGLLSDADGHAERVAFLKRMVTTVPSAGTNRILVSHRSNITAVADVALAEGEAVVLQPKDGRFDIVAQLMPDDWPILS